MIRHEEATEVAANVALGIDVGTVAILNRGDVDVWARADGTPAAIEADDCRVIPPGIRRTIEVATNGPTIVSILAEGAGATAKVEIEA